ncbi:MAG TPA: UDP-N-acetylglucosamine 1-carboxyvinyltransferase [Anaerolineales bacterium]|nr:UDP-N-acetylglucosamine 1-carboxyvinyltransferase [Anaerolineales bacterium]
MQKFVITGGVPLSGEVTPAGNKNAALPILAACLLATEPVVLHNMPRIRDVMNMRSLIESLGAQVVELSPNSWQIHTPTLLDTEPDEQLCKRIRASILLAGPLLARRGYLQIPVPGGDVIGRRRLDTHLLIFEALGATYQFDGKFHFKSEKLHGANILLDEASVTATENGIMAAVMAEGTTVFRNAASEPHIVELCNFLNGMGAKIHGVGSNLLTIEGVQHLGSTEHTIGPDYLEVISFVGAAVVTGGEILIRNAGLDVLDMVALQFARLGVRWEARGSDLWVPANQSLRVQADFGNAVPKFEDAVWPGFPADLLSIAIVVATQCEGTVLFHEKMYESRLYFTDKLVAMGARIILCDPHRAIVQGKSQLLGERLESPDIRAGMAMLLATLAARGTSHIGNIGQIDRGYEQVEQKLRALGAKIERLDA